MKTERIWRSIIMIIFFVFFIMFFVDLLKTENHLSEIENNLSTIENNLSKIKSHISTTESYCYQCGDRVGAEDNYCDNCGLGLNPQTIYKCGKCIYESEFECEVCPSCGCNVIVEITSGGGRIEKNK